MWILVCICLKSIFSKSVICNVNLIFFCLIPAEMSYMWSRILLEENKYRVKKELSIKYTVPYVNVRGITHFYSLCLFCLCTVHKGWQNTGFVSKLSWHQLNMRNWTDRSMVLGLCMHCQLRLGFECFWKHVNTQQRNASVFLDLRYFCSQTVTTLWEQTYSVYSYYKGDISKATWEMWLVLYAWLKAI